MAAENKEKLKSLDQHGLGMTTGEDLRSQKHRFADNASKHVEIVVEILTSRWSVVPTRCTYGCLLLLFEL